MVYMWHSWLPRFRMLENHRGNSTDIHANIVGFASLGLLNYSSIGKAQGRFRSRFQAHSEPVSGSPRTLPLQNNCLNFIPALPPTRLDEKREPMRDPLADWVVWIGGDAPPESLDDRR